VLRGDGTAPGVDRLLEACSAFALRPLALLSARVALLSPRSALASRLRAPALGAFRLLGRAQRDPRRLFLCRHWSARPFRSAAKCARSGVACPGPAARLRASAVGTVLGGQVPDVAAEPGLAARQSRRACRAVDVYAA
jgi:hypothetical protein